MRRWQPVLLLLAGCSGPSHMESQTPFEQGREAKERKDYTMAIAQLAVAVQNARDFVFVAALLEKGECHLQYARASTAARAENVDEALKDFTRALESPELTPEERSRALVGQGQALLAQGKSDEAREALKQVLAIESDTSSLRYLLVAHRMLGQLLIGEDPGAWLAHAGPTADPKRQDELREAQQHFSAGLKVDEEDATCNLGKGFCLYARGLRSEAVAYLREACRVTDNENTPNAQAHFFLALALETSTGLQVGAMEHYKRALQADSSRLYLPLYGQLVEVLLDYRSILDEDQFHWLLEQLLAYAGPETSYWERVESLATKIAAETPSALQPKHSSFARALARARRGAVAGAKDDALKLANEPDFLGRLAKIFPAQPSRPDYLLGRALTLDEAGRTEELVAFLDSVELGPTSPDQPPSEAYQQALLLKGRLLVESGRKLAEQSAPLTAEQKIERDNPLAKARDIFHSYLNVASKFGQRSGDVAKVRLSLGETLELMEAFSSALTTYLDIVQDGSPAAPEEVEIYEAAFGGILRLHRDKLLPEEPKSQAWSELQRYQGRDERIKDYVKKTEESLRKEAALYCLGCGRMGSLGDKICLECGRRIGTDEARP